MRTTRGLAIWLKKKGAFYCFYTDAITVNLQKLYPFNSKFS